MGGDYKRTPLKVEDFAGLRPTPERVRETVFDWIPHLLGGCAGRSFCDMFAGSGALGLEAASRGAEKVVFDTDMGNDCDDVLAQVMLLSYAQQARAEILCIATNKDNALSPKFVRLICEYYGFPSTPSAAGYPRLTGIFCARLSTGKRPTASPRTR